MNVTRAPKAPISRLQKMRKDAKLSQHDAVSAANELAKKNQRPERFSVPALRRWELFDTPKYNPKLHGRRPATVAQLSILMCVYGGSPNYLLLGIEPSLRDATPAQKALTEGLIHCINTVLSWPEDRQERFTQWFQENIRP